MFVNMLFNKQYRILFKKFTVGLFPDHPFPTLPGELKLQGMLAVAAGPWVFPPPDTPCLMLQVLSNCHA